MGANLAWCRVRHCSFDCVSVMWRRFVLVALLLLSGGVHAATTYRYSTTAFAGYAGFGGFSTAQAACQAGYADYVPRYNATQQAAQPSGSTISYSTTGSFVIAGANCSVNLLTVRTGQFNDNFTQYVTWVQVAADAVEIQADAAQIVVRDLNASKVSLQYSGTAYTLKACFGGFVVKGTGSAVGIKAGVGSGEIYGPFSTDGTVCTGADIASNAAPIPCKVGEFVGKVNNVDTCVKPFGATAAPVVKTAPTGTSLSDAPAGSATKTDSTVCAAGTCTTTSEFKNSSGGVTGVGTTEQSEGSFCQENPGAGICAAKSETEQQSACELDPDSLNCRDLDTPTVAVPGREETVSFTAENLGLGDGTCPAPVTVTTSNGTIVLSYTKWCDAMTTYVKPVILALAALMAFMIAFPRGES